jgi:hypothetical protein
MSQSRRAMIECIFGRGKQHGTMRKTKHPGIGRVAANFLLNLITYNVIRIPLWFEVQHGSDTETKIVRPELAGCAPPTRLSASLNEYRWRVYPRP